MRGSKKLHLTFAQHFWVNVPLHVLKECRELVREHRPLQSHHPFHAPDFLGASRSENNSLRKLQKRG